MKLKLGMGFLVLLTTVGLALADDTNHESSFSIGPRASYYSPKDGDSTWNGGAQMRFWPGHPFTLEAAADYRREDFGNGTKADIVPLQASLLFNLVPRNPLNFFLLGGVGWYMTHVDRPSPASDTDNNRFGLHAGGGVEFHLNSSWSVDGTYRYIWLEEIKSKDEQLQDKEYSDNGHQVTIALNYYF